MEKTDWLMRLLASQSNEVKIDLISRLSASLARKTHKKRKDLSFFSPLTNAWDDNVPEEDEIAHIREARTSGTTRKIIEF